MRIGHETSSPINPLSPRLEELGVDLTANTANYPEMQWELSESHQAEVDRLATYLSGMPVVHVTKAFIQTAPDGTLQFADGQTLLRPSTEIEGDNNAFPLDNSLELGEYTFWASADCSHPHYGDQLLVMNPDKNFWDNTVVTPNDIIYSVTPQSLGTPVDQLDPARRAKLQNEYLDKMVRGNDWHQIVARRVWKQLATQREHEGPLNVAQYMLGGILGGLGEVKYHGSVDISHAQLATVDDEGDRYAQFADQFLAGLGVTPDALLQRIWSINPDVSGPARREAERLSCIWEEVLDWPAPDTYKW